MIQFLSKERLIDAIDKIAISSMKLVIFCGPKQFAMAFCLLTVLHSIPKVRVLPSKKFDQFKLLAF